MRKPIRARSWFINMYDQPTSQRSSKAIVKLHNSLPLYIYIHIYLNLYLSILPYIFQVLKEEKNPEKLDDLSGQQQRQAGKLSRVFSSPHSSVIKGDTVKCTVFWETHLWKITKCKSSDSWFIIFNEYQLYARCCTKCFKVYKYK